MASIFDHPHHLNLLAISYRNQNSTYLPVSLQRIQRQTRQRASHLEPMKACVDCGLLGSAQNQTA